MSKEKEGQSYLRAVTALGNMAYSDSDATQLVQGMGISLNFDGMQGCDQKLRETIVKIASEFGLE